MEGVDVLSSAKRDVAFQRMLAAVVGDVLGDPGIVARPPDDRHLARELMERRGAFLEVWLFPFGFALGEAECDLPMLEQLQQRARVVLAELNELRNTPPAQSFLMRTPQFFERFDARVFAAFRQGAMRE